jgi:hypothetical protein
MFFLRACQHIGQFTVLIFLHTRESQSIPHKKRELQRAVAIRIVVMFYKYLR